MKEKNIILLIIIKWKKLKKSINKIFRISPDIFYKLQSIENDYQKLSSQVNRIEAQLKTNIANLDKFENTYQIIEENDNKRVENLNKLNKITSAVLFYYLVK